MGPELEDERADPRRRQHPAELRAQEGRRSRDLHADHPQLANPGAGLELANLSDGRFIVIYNDLERGRHSLAVSISDDEGATYKWTRHLEKQESGKGSFHYPSIIQARDGSLHASYSYFVPEGEGKGEGKSIKHARFGVDWVMAGDEAK